MRTNKRNHNQKVIADDLFKAHKTEARESNTWSINKI